MKSFPFLSSHSKKPRTAYYGRGHKSHGKLIKLTISGPYDHKTRLESHMVAQLAYIATKKIETQKIRYHVYGMTNHESQVSGYGMPMPSPMNVNELFPSIFARSWPSYLLVVVPS